jgi:hypothetical protein
MNSATELPFGRSATIATLGAPGGKDVGPREIAGAVTEGSGSDEIISNHQFWEVDMFVGKIFGASSIFSWKFNRYGRKHCSKCR